MSLPFIGGQGDRFVLINVLTGEVADVYDSDSGRGKPVGAYEHMHWGQNQAWTWRDGKIVSCLDRKLCLGVEKAEDGAGVVMVGTGEEEGANNTFVWKDEHTLVLASTMVTTATAAAAATTETAGTVAKTTAAATTIATAATTSATATATTVVATETTTRGQELALTQVGTGRTSLALKPLEKGNGRQKWRMISEREHLMESLRCRPATSCHLRYGAGGPYMKVADLSDRFELECTTTVEESADCTYFCVVGWGPGGYSGIQQVDIRFVATTVFPPKSVFLFCRSTKIVVWPSFPCGTARAAQWRRWSRGRAWRCPSSAVRGPGSSPCWTLTGGRGSR